jgi:hypothetical protein
MKKVAARIPFAGSQLGEARHVCAFFNSDDEEYRVLLPGQNKGLCRADNKTVPVTHLDTGNRNRRQ